MMDLTQRLSPHFTLGEMVRTSHRYIDNMPTPTDVGKLTELCLGFLEQARVQFGPLRVTSGFRCKNLNMAVGGSVTSAHMYGCAADFMPVSGQPAIELVDWLIDKSGLGFDQVIDEYSSTSNWIHLGMVRPVGGRAPRRQALTMRLGKYTEFDRSVVG